MMTGKFIVIDAGDGSGKSTQVELLRKRLNDEGRHVDSVHFPRHNTPPAYFVNKMLRGEYGPLSEQDPYKTSVWYAVDRADASAGIRESMEAGNIFVGDRYTSSNVGHQGGKFDTDEERREFFLWLDHFEYSIMKIPRPDLVIYLHVDPNVSKKFLDSKLERSGEKDIHEADINHLIQAEKSYLIACDVLDGWKKVECMDGDILRSKSEIHEEIYALVLDVINN